MRRELLIAGAAALLAGGAAWRLKPAPGPGPARVQTDTVYAERERPQLERPSIGQKISTAQVTPTKTRIADAPSSAGRKAVVTYCAPAITLQTSGMPATASSDTAAHLPESKPPALLPDFAGRIRGPTLTLYSTLNDGRRWSADYTARGRITWESSGDSALVRGDRLWVRLLRGGATCTPKIGANGLIGGLLDRDDPLRGAALSAGVAALGCLF